jgi:hypothetical protein
MLEYEGALYHITSHGNAQAAIYLDEEGHEYGKEVGDE